MSAPSVYRNALPLQTALHEYRIEQVLGAGGFGITYRARDTNGDGDGKISMPEFKRLRTTQLEMRLRRRE